ncbi:unnamed protein product, partial [Vitis vinifera]
MERNNFNNNLKDHSIGCRGIKDCSNNHKVKDSWNCNSGSYGEDCPDGFSWPPRSYTCSFCKREFRSAQALGGHMNVHRRDRARLRQSPPRDGQYPILNLNLNPNPNFSTSPSSSSPPTRLPPFTRTLPSLVSSPLSSLSSPSSASPSDQMKTTQSSFGVGEYHGFTQEDEYKVLKKAEFVRLDLEIGLLSDLKEDLDLELRLGYS